MRQLGSGMEEIEKVPGRWGKQSKWESFEEKKIQSELLKDVDDDEYRWLQCNVDPRETAAIFNLQEQIVETIR